MMTVYELLHLAVLLCNTSNFVAPCVDATVRCADKHKLLTSGYDANAVVECFMIKKNPHLPKLTK